jgi:hypothetical protein
VLSDREALTAHPLAQATKLGHAILRIEWDTAEGAGIGTCTRCGDGLLLYIETEGASIHGTAYESAYPGNTCAHGWAVVRTAEGTAMLRCLHCGAIRSEG